MMEDKKSEKSVNDSLFDIVMKDSLSFSKVEERVLENGMSTMTWSLVK